MMRTRSSDRLRTFVAGTVLGASLMAPLLGPIGVAAQESALNAASAAPADSVIYYELNLDLEGQQWQQADALLERVGVPNALDTWRQKLLTEGESAGEFSEADLNALMGGEVALVVSPLAVNQFVEMQQMMEQAASGMTDSASASATPVTDMDDGPLGIAVIMTPGDLEAAWDYVIRQSQSWAEKSGIELQVASGPGEELIWAEAPSVDADENAWEGDPFEAFFSQKGKGGFAVGRSGDYIVASSTVDDVSAIFDVIDGGSPALAADDEFVELSARIPDDNMSLAFIDTAGMIAQLDSETQEAIESFLPEEMSADALSSASVLAVGADDRGFRMNSVSTVPEGDDAAQLLVANNDFAVSAAETVPSGTFIFSAGEIPPASFAGAAFGMAQAVNESASGEMGSSDAMSALPSSDEIDAEIAKATATLGFDPASDLFDILGGEYLLFAPFPNISFDDFSWDAVATLETSDPARLADTMMSIANLAKSEGEGAAVTVRNEGADTIYTLADSENPGGPSLEFGVLGNRAVLASGNGINSLSTPPDEALADDAQFQEVMGFFPSEFGQVTYIDISQAAGPLMMLTGQFQTAGINDADVACLDFETQEAAQAAYEEDPIAQMDLDRDFDGTACEDAYVVADATATAEPGSLVNIRAFASVTYLDGGYMTSDALLYIPAPSS